MKRHWTATAAAIGIALLLVAAAVVAAGARINTSPSVPVGLYWASRAPVEQGAYVLVCPPPSGVFDAAHARGYIGAGFCAGGYGRLMKRVAATAGDAVSVSDEGVRVNGALLPLSAPRTADRAGRPMPQYVAEPHTLAADEVLLMGEGNPKSFDARYFGPIDRAQIVGVVRPIFTW